MQKESFMIGFDGEALVNHKIDAMDLSIALAGLSTILNVSNQVLNALQRVVNLYKNIEVRKAISALLEMLNKDGIDSFYTSRDNGKTKEQVVFKTEVEKFSYKNIEEKEVLYDTSTSTILAQIIGITFEDHLKWKLADGDNKFYAIVHDEVFLQKINNREVAFAKGDIL